MVSKMARKIPESSGAARGQTPHPRYSQNNEPSHDYCQVDHDWAASSQERHGRDGKARRSLFPVCIRLRGSIMILSVSTVCHDEYWKRKAKYEKPLRSLLACLKAGMLPKTTSSNKVSQARSPDRGNARPACFRKQQFAEGSAGCFYFDIIHFD